MEKKKKTTFGHGGDRIRKVLKSYIFVQMPAMLEMHSWDLVPELLANTNVKNTLI